MDWYNDKARDCIRECSVRISSGIPATLTEVFRGLRQSLQAHSGIVPPLGYDRFHPSPFQFTSHPTSTLYSRDADSAVK
jgi:hypothetical protein